MDTLLSQQPETNTQLLKRSLLLYRQGFAGCMLFSCILVIAIVISTPRFLFRIIEIQSFYHLMLIQLLLALLSFIALFLFIAMIWHLYCVARHIHEPFIEDISKGLHKVIAVFLASLIVRVIFFSIFLSMIYLQRLLIMDNLFLTQPLPGNLSVILFSIVQVFILLYISTLFSFLIPLIAIENKSIFHALKKSISLIWNHWWRAFSVQMTPWLCYFLLLIGIQFASHHMYFIRLDHVSIWPFIINHVLFVFFIPWVAALQLIQLKDFELRKLIPSHVSAK